MRPRRKLITTLALLIVVPGTLVATASAEAAFHEMRVREVFPGTAASPNSDFVELQMYSAGQNFVGGHPLEVYDQAGSKYTFTFSGNVPNGADQSTILIGASGTAGTGASTATPDFVDTNIQLSSAGGAVCFPDSDQPGECVAWGSFTPPAGGFPSPGPGMPAPAIPDGQSLHRSIVAGNPSRLEKSDDTDDSAADFFLGAPTPCPNSAAPSSSVCTGSPGPGPGPGGDSDPPNSTITSGAAGATLDRTPTFRFRASEQGSRFQCKLDGRPYRACRSPKTYGRLAFGVHVFRVRAVDPAGNADPTPGKRRFRIRRPEDR